MHKFTFSSGKAAQLRRKYINQVTIFVVIAAAAGVAASAINKVSAYADVRFLPFMLLVMGLPLGIALMRAYKRAKVYYDGYTLLIDDAAITNTQTGYQEVVLPINEVNAIGRYEDGGFVIVTDKGQLIIPAGLTGTTDLAEVLGQIKPIEPTRKMSFLFRYRNALLVTILGAYVCFLTMKDKYVVAGLGITLSAVLVWATIKIWTSPSIDQRIKRKIWIFFLLLFSLIGRTIIVLKG